LRAGIEGFSAGLLYRTPVEDLAFAHVKESFSLPVKVRDRTAKGLDGAYHAHLRTFERAGNGLFKFHASLVIEKGHCYVIVSLAGKVKLSFKGYPIVSRREGTLLSIGHTALDLPARDELRDGALPTPGLVVDITITVRLEGN
jgi:hypothetical protein